MVFENCSESVIVLAWIGGVALYLLVGALIGWLVSELVINIDKESRKMLVIFSIILWPLAIAVSIIYIVGMFILFPLFGATREYVDNTEDRINRKIDKQCSAPSDVSDDLDIFDDKAPFKAGDIITGIVPQTDKNGNNISYEHLYQGCKCRVLSIDGDGAMRVILIGHKDREAQKDYIGETFDAPARNFTLVKKPSGKRKAVKKRSKR